MGQYKDLNKAVPNTVIASKPINENWTEIYDAINTNYDLAVQVKTKIDQNLIAAANGLATLDASSKLSYSQLPDEAINKTYSVNSIAEQLALPANVGDICVRIPNDNNDISRTFVLAQAGANRLEHWVQIATTNSGGQVGSNSCYLSKFSEENWNYSGNYYIDYSNDEHLQGSTKFLQINITKEYMQSYIENDEVKTKPMYSPINCNYDIDEDGNIRIYTDVPFTGCIMISNLSGNVKNAQYIPYTVIKGPELDDEPNLIQNSYSFITVNCPFSVVDGFGVIRTINTVNPLTITDALQDGTYVLFVDSDKINNKEVQALTYRSKDRYFGVVKDFPQDIEHNSRCYIAYDQSYEYNQINESWYAKAFTPIGEFNYENGRITSSISYPYRDNNISVTSESKCFDYLFGNKIEGYEVSILDGNMTIQPGRAFGQKNLIVSKNEITKNTNESWRYGDNQGCLDLDSMTQTIVSYVVTDGVTNYYISDIESIIEEYVEAGTVVYIDPTLTNQYKIAEESEFTYTGQSSETPSMISNGWGYIYIINNSANEIDALLSMDTEPKLPLGYEDYKLIGYFNINQNVQNQITKGRKTYIKPLVLDDFNIDIEDNDTLIVNIQSTKDTDIYYNDYVIYTGNLNNVTIEIPNMSSIDRTISYSVTDGNTVYYVDIPDSRSVYIEDHSYVATDINVYRNEDLTELYKESEELEFYYTGESNAPKITLLGYINEGLR